MQLGSRRSHIAQTTEDSLELGAFSISLAVKDLEASRTFYEKPGFRPFAGDPVLVDQHV